MQPTVGRSVHYQRGGQILHAVITRVVSLLDPEAAATAPDLVVEESSYEVWLAVFIHTVTVGSVEFSPMPIPFSPTPADKRWSWPPRVS